jgi:hypothetical protein
MKITRKTMSFLTVLAVTHPMERLKDWDDF